MGFVSRKVCVLVEGRETRCDTGTYNRQHPFSPFPQVKGQRISIRLDYGTQEMATSDAQENAEPAAAGTASTTRKPPKSKSRVQEAIDSLDLASYGGDAGQMHLLCYLAGLQDALQDAAEASLILCDAYSDTLGPS